MRGWAPHPFAAFARRWGKRWFAVLGLPLVVAVLGAFTLHRAFIPAAIVIDSHLAEFPADGFSTTELKLRSSNGRSLRDLSVGVDDPHRASVDSVQIRGDVAVVKLRAGVMPGETTLRVAAANMAPSLVKVKGYSVMTDSVGDGTPDFLRLHDHADQQAFRVWFAFLAETQYYREQSNREVEDCAALLRYAYKEALREHDAAWAKAVALSDPPATGEIRQYHYPFSPLGADLFRVRDGSFAADDLKSGAFAQFADAKTLWRYNSHFVGREISEALAGDLLFFRQAGHELPFHAMIFLGRSQIDRGRETLVIYHTGPTGRSKGEIRLLEVTELMNYPDPRWRPVPSNPSFLGVYRWNILQGTD
jgi:uncharacterized protein YfaT (DUF1175 family)